MKKVLLTINTLLIIASLAYSQIYEGSFEAGKSTLLWDQASTNFGFVICDTLDPNCGSANGDIYPRTGDKFVWLGGVDGAPETSSIAQNINIPIGDSAKIQIYLRSYSNDTLIAADHFMFTLGTDTLMVLIRQDSLTYSEYTLIELDVSQYANNSSYYFMGRLVQSTALQWTINLDDAQLLVNGNVVSDLFSGEMPPASTLPYPNPSSDFVNFDLLVNSTNTRIEIYDITGVKQMDLSLEDPNTTTWTIPVEELEKGQYFYKTV